MSLQHLYAMGIQRWQLKTKTQVAYLLVSDEEFAVTSDQLLSAMLASIDFHKEQILTSALLKQQITSLQPSVILILGKLAANNLLNCDASIEDLRGKIHIFANTPTVVTYHPAHLLQHPKNKCEAYEDLCMVHNILPS